MPVIKNPTSDGDIMMKPQQKESKSDDEVEDKEGGNLMVSKKGIPRKSFKARNLYKQFNQFKK